jgi:glyoxylase-like metal-dependent hydrolase (beta-lactamase superfamily II)
MAFAHRQPMSRRGFCLCCIAGGTCAAVKGWLTPREAFAEARGIVSLIKDSAAVSPIITHELRDNISVLEGSGGNIAVLTGPDGKVLVDAGIGVSRPQITKALAALGADPITHLIATHWHFDHTDGNEWLHGAGAEIIAQSEGRKHLSEIQRVEDGDYNFLPAPAGAIPSEVFTTERSLLLNGASIGLKHYGPAHTDSDISVKFAEANILHAGDSYWNGIYPFIDYSTGGNIDGMIAASDANLAATTDQTIIIPGHGQPVSNRSELQQFRDMLVAIRDNVATLKKQGKIARRDRCGQANRRFRREMGRLRHRSRLLHEAGLRGRLTAKATWSDRQSEEPSRIPSARCGGLPAGHPGCGGASARDGPLRTRNLGDCAPDRQLPDEAASSSRCCAGKLGSWSTAR